MSTNFKNKILAELNSQAFPNLEFLYSDEVLNIALVLLRELLEEEKAKFEKLLQTSKSEITFDIFEDKDDLGYLWSLLNHLNNVNKTEKIKKIIDDFEGEYIEFGNEIGYNKDYFEMYLYCLENCKLDDEQKRIIEETVKSFRLRGIDLEKDKQDEIKTINKKLAKLSNDFSNNIVDDEAEFFYTITNFEDIKNLPESTLKLAKSLAKEKGVDGYVFNADPTAYIDLMKYCINEKIRQEIYTAFQNFATKGKYDNRPIILEILRLKKKKAELLGYKNFAEYNIQKKMAESPEQVFELVGGISAKAKVKALQEIEELKTHFGLSDINPWDLSFYSTKLKEEKYALDDKELKKYFEYNSVINYLHKLVNELYSIELREIEVPVYNSDVKVYEVLRDGKLISYYFLDAFYREEKRPGAWADNLRGRMPSPPAPLPKGEESSTNEIVPLVVNVCNFQKSSDGVNLLSMRDVETLFHEFGHALHEMLSESKHSELSGFGVEWDFVELPSQLHENWVGERESLVRFAKHHATGEQISDELLDKLDALKTFMSGNFVVRQNEFALLDMHLYTSEVPASIEELDKKTLNIVNEVGLFKRGDDYKMYASFGHIFGGGYAAGYYSYMWAEIIEADVWSEIKRLGMFERSTGEKFVKTILGQGCRKDAKDLFFDFMGREVDNKAFMERKGLM
ncbi:MAG: M3 family metallopeptidase [Candidatus Gracilibacteria bacterium]|nr:M3 family metallopeptidase [Candidatus Gracilibacteria bacterium]